MRKVIFNMSMSLDGFIASPKDEIDQLFKWYFSGDTEVPPFKVSQASAELLGEAFKTTGATVYGRRTFDVAGAWAGNPPMGVPCFILTHQIPQEWVKEGSPFTFVTDGIESAIEQAKQVVGDKNIAVGSATTLQQCIKAKLLDEIHIDLVPVLLGTGIKLFENLGTELIKLKNSRAIEGSGVTHLRFRVVK